MRKTEGAVTQPFGVLFQVGSLGGWRDEALLARFLAERDATAEVAFATLVERHGPMVLRVCHARLGDEHQAHDAFQAVFLVLARKARRVRVSHDLGPWLYGVAWRVASRARAAEAKRRRHELRAAALQPRSAEPVRPDDDTEAVLHEEICRLPLGFREAVVLCDLRGLTTDQAAEQLGAPVGTVRSRLARGRDRLRSRLVRRGFGPAAVGLALSARPASAVAVPAALARSTIQMVIVCCQAGVIPARLTQLVVGGKLVTGLHAAAAGLALGMAVWAVGGPNLLSHHRPHVKVGNPRREPTAHRPYIDANAAEVVATEGQTDRDRLQGTWRVVRATLQGKELAGPKVLRVPMVFEGDTVEFGPFGDPANTNRYQFGIDAESDPRALRVVRDGAPSRWWLYELRGDRLRTAAWRSLDDTTRPKGFADGAADHELMVLELARDVGAPAPAAQRPRASGR